MTKVEKEKIIQNFMVKLDLTREQAEQLFEDDKSAKVLPQVVEIEKKAKECGRHYEQSAAPRKKVEKERKIDSEKQDIIKLLANTLENVAVIDSIKNEIGIEFIYNGNNYGIKLTKHRNK